jgi:hypothetical protein
MAAGGLARYWPQGMKYTIMHDVFNGSQLIDIYIYYTSEGSYLMGTDMYV